MLNHYPSQEIIRSIIDKIGFDNVTFEIREYTKYYEDALSILKVLKKIGADNPYLKNKSVNHFKSLKKLIRYYDSKFKYSNGVKVTYEILFIKGEKG